jgi:enoyl-CoA hydratase/carnithine racemase
MTDTPRYEQIEVDDDGKVGVVTLNRPDRLNAWTWLMGAELDHAIATLDARDEIRAIVVTGAGRAFCAGADLGGGSWQSSTGDRREVLRRYRTDGRKAFERNTPIIAAMNGAAVGVGMTMAMEWDIRVAAEDGKYGFVFTRRGVVPEVGSQWLVPRLVGLSRGLELLMTGRTFRGREGADIGLFSTALSADEVLPHCLEMAQDIAVNVAPVSAAIVKRNVYRSLSDTDRSDSRAREERLFGYVVSRPDANEAAAAYVEKREPAWKLRKNADTPDDLLDG